METPRWAKNFAEIRVSEAEIKWCSLAELGYLEAQGLVQSQRLLKSPHKQVLVDSDLKANEEEDDDGA
jgi:hypothetical protein